MKFQPTPRIAIIGLGYVGLPLAVEFGKVLPCIGFDIDQQRINELNSGKDSTQQTSAPELAKASQLSFSTEEQALKGCTVYIITVPTPIDQSKRPDLTHLTSASKLIASVIDPGDIVIYESTVYPGCTEEVCIPIIQKLSGLIFNQDFFAGYSPERINPGDKTYQVTNIVKVTSGSTPAAADFVDQLYQKIVSAGTHQASSIKVAEAAKVIENTQRDVNIALVNELAIIFNHLDINTEDVLAAAATKWNFLPFHPGLVGGHCIGVDPYYLVHKAELSGYHPEIISASRRINDNMGAHVASRVMHLMTQKRIHIVDSRILIMGLAFKEDCPDLRNTRVTDIIDELTTCNAKVDIYDPWVCAETARSEYAIELIKELPDNTYDAIIIAVGHSDFKTMPAKSVRKLTKNNGIIFDVKYILPEAKSDGRL